MPTTNDEWSSRHSVLSTARRTAALVNALSVPDPDAGTIIRVLRDHGEIGPIDLSAGDLADMRAAAVLLRDVFAAEEVNLAATRLNRLLAEHTVPVRLSSHRGRTPWHPHLDRDDNGPWGEWLLASSCMALAVLIWDRQAVPGGVCVSPSCPDVYLAQGSGQQRRYCSRRCATRERVAAHRRSRT